MTDAGSELLKKITGQNVGRRIAIVLDGQVLIAPMIRGEIAKSVEIRFGQNADRKQWADILGRLHAAVNVLPATQPSR
jgi:preprotein translocase subunit SecD